jgi:hypothetical protein
MYKLGKYHSQDLGMLGIAQGSRKEWIVFFDFALPAFGE